MNAAWTLPGLLLWLPSVPSGHRGQAQPADATELRRALDDAAAAGDRDRSEELIRGNQNHLFRIFETCVQEWIEGGRAGPHDEQPLRAAEAIAQAAHDAFGGTALLEMLARLREFDDRDRSSWLEATDALARGQAAAQRNSWAESLELLAAAHEVFETLGWIQGMARAQLETGICLLMQDRAEVALEPLRSACELFARTACPLDQVIASHHLGLACGRLGRVEECDDAFTEALRFAEQVSTYELLWRLKCLGEELCRFERHDRARELYSRKREVGRALGDEQETAAAVRDLVRCNTHPWPPPIDVPRVLVQALARGDSGEVETLLERYPTEAFQAFEDCSREWIQDRGEAAAPHLERARALATVIQGLSGADGLLEMTELLAGLDEGQRGRWLEAWRLLEDAQALLDGDDDATAIPLLEESQRRFGELGWIPGLARTNLLLGRQYEALDDLQAASRHSRAACGFADAVGNPELRFEAYMALGSALIRGGHDDLACNAIDSALAAGAQLRPARILSNLDDLAVCFEEQGRYELARRYHERALGLAREACNLRAVLDAMAGICSAYLAEGREEECVRWFVAVRTQLGELPAAQCAMVEPWIDKGTSWIGEFALGDAYAAMELHCTAALGSTTPAARTAHFAAAQALAESLDQVQGVGFYRREVAFRAALDAERGRQWIKSDICSLIGLMRIQGGGAEPGVRWFGEAHAILTGLGSALPLAHVDHHLAACLTYVDRFRESLALFRDAARIFAEMGEPSRATHSLTLMGNTLVELGEYEEALAVFRQVLSTKQDLGDHFGVALCRNSLGACLTATGQHAEAIACLEEALGIWRVHGDLVLLARCLHLLGTAFLAAGEPGRALACLEEAAGLPDDGPEGDGIKILLGLGAALNALQRPDEAERYLDRALAEVEVFGNRIWTAAILDERGAALRALGQLGRAVDDHTRALEILVEFGQHRDAARSLFHLANCAAAQGRHEDVLELLGNCVGHLERVPRRSLSEEDRRRFLAQWARVPELASQAAVACPDSDRAIDRGLSVVDAFLARTLLEGLQEKALGVLETLDPELAAERERTLDEMQDLRLALARQASPAKRGELMAAERRLEDLDQRLRAGRPGLRELVSPSPATLAEVTQVLGAGEALLLYVLGEERSFVWLISRDRSCVLPLCSQAEIRRSWEALSRALDPSGPRDQGFIEPARELYRMLLAEARSRLAPRTDLLIVPDGFLGFLPFEVLLTRDVPTVEREALERLPYLVSELSVRYLPSASFLVWSRGEATAASRAPLEMLLLGDPLYAAEREAPEVAMRSLSALDPERLVRLHATRQEVLSIAGSLLEPGEAELRGVLESLPRSAAIGGSRFDLCLGVEASKRRLCQDPGRYRMLHLAVHGFLDPEYPWFSGLVLGADDGEACSFLSLVEIASLDLDADLVFLSACDTARGELAQAEGIRNTARSFLLAGARAVVATQWTVSDEASALFARHFYDRLFAGAPAAEALRMAKLASLSREVVDAVPARGIGEFRPGPGAAGMSAHPAFWAPFVLWGS